MNQCISPRLARMAGIAVAMAGAFTAQAAGETAPKEIKILVSHAAGGGYDLYARLLSRHIASHLAGSPSVVVQNMPGAAGVIMTNYLQSSAVRDGSTIGVGPGSIATAALFGSPGAKYDATQLTWIGSLNSDVVVATAWQTAPVKTADELFTTELVVGGVGATDNSVIYPNLLNRLLGTRFKIVSGYKGSSETALAMERGELQGIAGWNFASLQGMKPEWLTSGTVRILLQYALTPHPELPNVPLVMSYAKTDAQREVLRLILTQLAIGRVVVAPPGLPAERTAALRKAIGSLLVDPVFRADADTSKLELLQPRTGVEIQELVTGLHATAPELVTQAAEAIGARN